MSVAKEEVRSFVERVERLNEEKAAITTDIAEVFAEAKAKGYDVKALREVIKLRKLAANERDEREHMLEVYLRALDMRPDFEA